MVNLFIPIITIIILAYGIYKKIDIFDTFIVGVREGLEMSLKIFPTIFAMIIAVTMLTSSNIISDLSRLINPLLRIFNFPSELIPLAFLRSISGSSSLALLNDILLKHGADSYIGRIASVMQGTTDTTIYIISMYFSSVGVKKIKYSLAVGLLADLISIALSVIMINIFFY